MRISWHFQHIRCADQPELAFYMEEKSILDEMPPFLGGGDMIKKVHLRSFVTE